MAEEKPLTVNFDGDSPDLVPMYDHVNKAVVQVPHADIDLHIRSGKYSLPKGIELPVIGPDGDSGTITSDKAQSFFKKYPEYRLENQEETHKRVVEEKYGDSELLAGAAGVARGATLGVSDQLLTKTGLVNPKTLSGLEEANPVASGVGEVGGFAAGLLGPAEAMSLVRGAEIAGKIAEKSAAKFLTKEAAAAGISKSVASSIAAKMAPKIAGSAVEGAFYGAGNLLSEEALGRADFNAENLVGSIGTGALIGGAAGSILGGAKLAAPSLKELGAKVSAPFKDLVAGLTDRNKAALEIIYETPTQILKAQERNPKLVSELPDFLQNEVGWKVTDSAATRLSKVEKLQQKAGSAIDDIITTVDDELVKGGTKPSYKVVADDMANAIEKEFIVPNKAVPGFSGQVAPIEKFVGELRDVASKEMSVKELQTIRQKIDSLIKFEKTPGKFTLFEDALFEARTIMRDKILSIADAASTGERLLGNELRAANRHYAYASEILPGLEKKAAKSGDFIKWGDAVLGGVGYSIGTPAIAAGMLYKFAKSDLRRNMVALGMIEKANNEVLRSIGNGLKGFFTPAVKVVAPYTQYKFSESDYARSEDGKKPKSKQEAWANLNRNLNDLATNPNKLVEKTNRKTSLIYEAAPNTSAAMDMVAQRAVTFLNSKLPRTAQDQSMLEILKPKKLPSSFEIAKFERYMKAVEDPKGVIKDFEKGIVTKEALDSLKNVYPTMYGALQQATLDYIAKDAPELDYAKRIRLGLLLEMPTDFSMLPENVLGLQSLFSQQISADMPGSAGSVVQPSQTGINQIESGNRAQTPLQRVQNQDD